MTTMYLVWVHDPTDEHGIQLGEHLAGIYSTREAALQVVRAINDSNEPWMGFHEEMDVDQLPEMPSEDVPR